MGFLEEIMLGPQAADALMNKVEHGGFRIPLILVIDAKSVYDAITATDVKVPSEQHLKFHVMKIREWLDRGVLDRIVWVDNRCMLADALTKGSATRLDLLRACNEGQWTVNVPFLSWRSPHNPHKPS